MARVIELPRTPAWTFAERIRKIRRDAGMTQAAFGEALGVKDRSIAAYETGQNKPGDMVAFARKVEDAFGVDPAWTLGLADYATTTRGYPAANLLDFPLNQAA